MFLFWIMKYLFQWKATKRCDEMLTLSTKLIFHPKCFDNVIVFIFQLLTLSIVVDDIAVDILCFHWIFFLLFKHFFPLNCSLILNLKACKFFAWKFPCKKGWKWSVKLDQNWNRWPCLLKCSRFLMLKLTVSHVFNVDLIQTSRTLFPLLASFFDINEREKRIFNLHKFCSFHFGEKEKETFFALSAPISLSSLKQIYWNT